MSKVHDLINQERKKRGIHTVYWSREMARLAQSQANYCARVGRLIHSHRFAFQGGENLAEGGGNFPPRAIVNCWLRSKAGHREYLLSSMVRKAGIGISKSKGKTYVAWAFSDVPPTYPDCPYYKPHRPKLQSKGKRRINLLALKLFLSLLAIAGFVDIIYRGHILLTHQISPVIGTILFLVEVGFWIWLVIVLRRPKYRYSRPNFKLVFASVLGIVLVCAFAGIEPLASYKDNVLNKITISLSSNKSILNNTQDVLVPTIPSATSGDTTTVPTAPPITTPKPITPPEPKLQDPTWNQLLEFLKADNTDAHPYIYPTFVCADFAKMLQDNAHKAGWRCAIVHVELSGYPDWYDYGIPSETGHSCNAFNTADRGLVYIDDTRTAGVGPANQDHIVYIQVGGGYTPKALFPTYGWLSTSLNMGTVVSVSDPQW
jgi:hypothetical protein